MDNYAYLIIDEETGVSAIIDPSEVAPIVKTCHFLNLKPDYILNTHHHFDHVEGNLELKALYGANIVGRGKKIPGLDIEVGETFILGNSQANIISAEGHAKSHVLYHFAQSKALFTGDILFNLCIGGLFEGTEEEMFESMRKIKSLPDETLFYPGHEYTKHAAAFALRYGGEGAKAYVEKAKKNLAQGLPAGPFTLGEEKQANPYLKAQTLEEFKSLF